MKLCMFILSVALLPDLFVVLRIRMDDTGRLVKVEQVARATNRVQEKEDS